MARDPKPSGRRQSSSKPLARRAAFREPKRTIVVFCEGAVTEPDYLSALKALPEVRDVAAVKIRIEHSAAGSAPMTLVESASQFRAAKSSESAEVDQVWCIFDVEWPINHPRLHDAIELARGGGVELAISNPCFELWLALHFADHTAWLDNGDAHQLRSGHDKSVDKRVDGALYMHRRQEAAERAKALEANHFANGTEFPDNNPSSGMFRFLEAVEGKKLE